jgi:hypothetical protein
VLKKLTLFFPLFYICAGASSVFPFLAGLASLPKQADALSGELYYLLLFLGIIAFLGVTIAVCNVYILRNNDLSRKLHLWLVWPFTIGVVFGTLVYLSAANICTDDCQAINAMPSEIAFFAITAVFFLMLAGSVIYLNLPKVKDRFKTNGQNR